MKPIIGITMGDPAGVGSEIIVKALKNKSEIYEKCLPVVIGDSRAVKDAMKFCDLYMDINSIDNIEDAIEKDGVINILDLKNIDISSFEYGKVNGICGKAAGEYIEKGIELAQQKKINAIVTGPINKESFDLGGYGKKHRGHTEMLASLTGSKKVAMLLASGKLRVIHVTTHLSLKKALDVIKTDRIYETIKIAQEACRQLGIENPKIGVSALNPHGGEGGIMGEEELTEIIPAIEKANNEGIDAKGPFPADTIFPKGISGTFDIIVAMYHDQGHIPVKLKGFQWDGTQWSSVSGVNITIGLPIIRTSVDHGTAFGKAGKGIADENSLIDAIDYAVIIAENRNL